MQKLKDSWSTKFEELGTDIGQLKLLIMDGEMQEAATRKAQDDLSNAVMKPRSALRNSQRLTKELKKLVEVFMILKRPLNKQKTRKSH